MVDVTFTDVVENVSPAVTLSSRIDFGPVVMVCGGISHGVKMIVIAGDLAVKNRDDVLRPVAVPYAATSVDFRA